MGPCYFVKQVQNRLLTSSERPLSKQLTLLYNEWPFKDALFYASDLSHSTDTFHTFHMPPPHTHSHTHTPTHTQLSERPLGDGREDDSAHPFHGEETDVVPPLPTILVTESKSMRIKHKRMSNPIKDDNQDYLEGYGANYGAVSSTTDLEKERLPKYAEKDIAKKLKQKRKVSEESEKSPKKAKKKFGLFSRSKKMVEDKTQAEVTLDYKEIPSPTKSTVRFAEVLIEDDFTKRDSGLTDISLGVNTSLGSEHSEGSLVENGCGQSGCGLERLELPTEEESISEQVRRLQVSVEEYNHEEMKDRKVRGRGGKCEE